jgi:hypothetical protein
MRDTDFTSQLLTQLLSDRPPEFGARLKQRLNATFAEKGMGKFDERSFGFKRFQDFLEQGHGHLITVQRPSGAGDILVSLKIPKILGTPRTVQIEPAPIRSDIWQAFTNPDSTRKRFLNKQTLVVRHFNEAQEPQASYAEVTSSPDEFIEITPIGGETQIEWMRRFLEETVNIPSDERIAFEAMLTEPYSSGVNAAFTRALGEHSTAWRNYRSRRILDSINNWARQHEVQMDRLRVQPRQPADMTENVHGGTAPFSAREQVIKLLELLSDDDINRLVLPTLLSTILIKSRL